MNKLEFGKDIKLLQMGNEFQISGLVFSGQERSFITLLPHKHDDIYEPIDLLPLSNEQMEEFMRQLDIVETEIFTQSPNGQIIKAIVRKTQRQIDSNIQWQVFKRDNYHCRYCYRDGIPLSVDHIVIWEEGGATIVDNLLTACKSCNRDRGSTSYVEWLKSPIYIRKSVNLPESVKNANLAVALDIPRLESLKVQNLRSR